MAMTTRMMIYAFLLYGGIFAAIVAVIARVIKYLIRYGIDYYFEKLAQNQKHKAVSYTHLTLPTKLEV